MRTKPEADYWKRVVEWCHGQDTGISSRAILQFMTGAHVVDPMPPGDSWDFGRCERLLRLFPSWRRRMPALAKALGKRDKRWRPLVREWARLRKLYDAVPAEKWNKPLYDAMLKATGWR